MPSPRNQTRLPTQYYVGTRSHFITICCDLRQPHLANRATADMVRGCLIDCARRYSFVLHAYCLMPDHLHFLAQGTHPSADLTKFIRILKSRTAFAFRRHKARRLWEMSYFDHILRSSDSPEEIAHYIWWNPVRKNLCRSPSEFPFSGSQTIPWKAQPIPPPPWSPPWRTKPASLKTGHYTITALTPFAAAARKPGNRSGEEWPI
jgi:putative transposase